MSPNELEHHRQRMLVERALAAQSANPSVAAIHHKLADAYEKIVALEEETKATLSSVA